MFGLRTWLHYRAPVEVLDHPAITAAGLVVAVAGFAGVLGAQSAMGRSWRIGVDPNERTELVTAGSSAASATRCSPP